MRHQSRGRSQCSDNNNGTVQLVRVGVLKNILVLTYGNLSIVLMVVSWVAKHTHDRPRLRRDSHGFWLANMAARPRDTTNPYLLPALASQVVYIPLSSFFSALRLWVSMHNCGLPNHSDSVGQVFFVEDKAMPGWSVVMKKESRSRRINSMEDEHGLGTEGSRDDLEVITNMQSQRLGPSSNSNAVAEIAVRPSNGRRRNRRDI